jgi:integrase
MPKPPTRRAVLTDRALKALKPAAPGKREIVWDVVQRYLGVRVTENGVKSFVLVKRRHKAPHPETVVLGRYPAKSLADARTEAEAMLKIISAGRSPKDVRAEAEREEARRRADTFATAVEKFVADKKERRTHREIEAVLRREFLGQQAKRTRNGTKWVIEWVDGKDPIWRNRPILDITRRDVVERLDEIKARNGKHAARHALSIVRSLFNSAADGERFGLEKSPAARVRDKTIGVTKKDLERKRVLAEDELRDVWLAAGEIGFPFGVAVQLLMLTGQRVNDVTSAKRSEIDAKNATLHVPPERFKTGDAQQVPLTARATALIASVPTFKGEYLFTTTAGARPISGLSKMKDRLDAAIAARRKEDGRGRMAHWVLHDLRRTVRTRLVSDLGVDAFIAERVLGHALPGLHGVYDQGTHHEQKRAALTKWEAFLLSIVEPPAVTDKVVPMRRRRR